MADDTNYDDTNYKVWLGVRDGCFELSWDAETMGTEDYIGLFEDPLTPDKDYYRPNDSWAWANKNHDRNPNPFKTNRAPRVGWEARYLVPDKSVPGGYRAVARTGPFPDIVVSSDVGDLTKVSLGIRDGRFELSWDAETMGTEDYIGLFEDPLTPDKDYYRPNDSWAWANKNHDRNPNPFKTNRAPRVGWEARYLVPDGTATGGYRSVARTGPFPDIVLSAWPGVLEISLTDGPHDGDEAITIMSRSGTGFPNQVKFKNAGDDERGIKLDPALWKEPTDGYSLLLAANATSDPVELKTNAPEGWNKPAAPARKRDHVPDILIEP